MNVSMFITIAQAATEVHTAPVSGGIGALGLDWRSLLFQVVNFVILLAALRAFAYKPILSILEARRLKIEESLKNAETIAATRAALKAEEERIFTEARQAAQQVVQGGKERAEQLVREGEEKAKARAEQILAQATAKIAHDVATARASLRTETLDLVVTATEKIIEVKLDPKKDAELIRVALQQATH